MEQLVATTRRILFGSLVLLAAVPQLEAADTWQVIKHEGRDYLTIDSIARFYEFPSPIPKASQITPVSPQEPLTKRLRLQNGKHELEFTISSRDAVIDGVHQWLGFPISIENDQLLISRLDLVKVIEPSLRPDKIAGMGPVQTVVLDPGHGAHDRGAVCIFGCEKDFALDVCSRAKTLLEAAGLRVVMTRQSDVFIPLEQRPRVANNIPNSIFVAVHFNDSLGNPNASGFEIFSITPQGEPSTADSTLSVRDLRVEPGNVVDVQSEALSASIYHAVLGNLPHADRGMKHARFAVIRLATVPSVLIEGGFLSNGNESAQVATAAWRQRYANAIVTGIRNYKVLAEQKVPFKVVSQYRRELNPGASAPMVMTNPALPPPVGSHE